MGSGNEPRRIGCRRLVILIVAVGLLALVLVGLFTVAQGWIAFGHAPEGMRLSKMQRSTQWLDDAFENPQPLWNSPSGSVSEFWKRGDERSPDIPLPVVAVEAERFSVPSESGLRVTWLGHSTLLIEIDGHTFLADPVWSERVSPVTWAGPQRWYAPPLELEAVPKLDAVILSHDHYDHLDYPTIAAMNDWDTLFIAPLGVGAHLQYWGVPGERIVELDWWETHSFGDLELTATPARHASGRHLLDRNRTLWVGYALVGNKHRVFYSGDTGLFPAMSDIGDRLGPFDITMIEVGAYGQSWPDWHLGPEQAVKAHVMLRGKVMLPVHWGLFDLAFHNWTAPIERVLVAAERVGVEVAMPRPGESFEPTAPPQFDRWWPEVPWRNAQEYPIVATGTDGEP